MSYKAFDLVFFSDSDTAEKVLILSIMLNERTQIFQAFQLVHHFLFTGSSFETFLKSRDIYKRNLIRLIDADFSGSYLVEVSIDNADHFRAGKEGDLSVDITAAGICDDRFCTCAVSALSRRDNSAWQTAYFLQNETFTLTGSSDEADVKIFTAQTVGDMIKFTLTLLIG